MNSRFPTVAIFITAASWTGFPVWLGANPDASALRRWNWSVPHSAWRAAWGCRSKTEVAKQMTEPSLQRDGYCVLNNAIDPATINRLIAVRDATSADENRLVRARSRGGHVYTAGNLVESIAEVPTVWCVEPLLSFLSQTLGEAFGLVRALYLDQPPSRT